MACIEARGLRKTFGTTVALDGIDLRVEEGRILGLIGPNGAGKTTALNAILGLTPYQGELQVLGRDPWTAARSAYARCLPSSPTSPSCRAGSGVAGCSIMSPASIRDSIAPRRKAFWQRPPSSRRTRSGELSKGMVAQLHLALVMAIDARLLVLDEPTLGLDILYRKQFYDSLLNDYFDRSRTIVVTTHQVEEIQDVLTDVIFIDRGRIVLELQHGRIRVPLSGTDGASRTARRRARAQADLRASALRPQHPALRSCAIVSSSARSATCAHPASPTCSLLSSVRHQGAQGATR